MGDLDNLPSLDEDAAVVAPVGSPTDKIEKAANESRELGLTNDAAKNAKVVEAMLKPWS